LESLHREKILWAREGPEYPLFLLCIFHCHSTFTPISSSHWSCVNILWQFMKHCVHSSNFPPFYCREASSIKCTSWENYFGPKPSLHIVEALPIYHLHIKCLKACLHQEEMDWVQPFPAVTIAWQSKAVGHHRTIELAGYTLKTSTGL
jgi:hypothetical protein